AGSNGNHRANSVAIGSYSDELDSQAVIGHAFIVEEVSAAAVRGHQHIQRAVVINVGVCGTASNFWSRKCAPERLRSFDELATAKVAEHMRRLGIADALLYLLDLIFNVPVRDENIRPTVVVIIKEEASEAERDQGRATHFGAGSFVHKQPVAFVVIKRKHLVGEVSNDQAGAAGAVVVGGIHAHAGACHAIFAESYASGDSFLFKRSVALVQVKLVWLSVVCEHDVGPAIAVVVEDGDPEGFRSAVEEVRLLRRVFKFVAAE